MTRPAQRKASLVVAQSGGPTPVINASLVGVVMAALANNRVGRVLGARFGAEGLLHGDYVDLGSIASAMWDGLRTTPSAALGSCRRKLSTVEREMILDRFIEIDCRYFIYIGGNDSADTALGIHEAAVARGYELHVLSVPKTIDNDLPGTDHCPGYGSAARYIAQSTQDASLDTEAMRLSDPIKIIEVMGRDAGWLVAASVLGKRDARHGPHVLCLPERPINVEHFIGAMENAYRAYGYAIAVVAETVRDEHGKSLGGTHEIVESDAFGHPTLQGAAAALCVHLSRALRLKTRFDKPGTLQRMSGALLSMIDVDEAQQAGSAAVEFAVSGLSGYMAGFERVDGPAYASTCVPVDLRLVANKQRVMPDEFLGSNRYWVSDSFEPYARPLIGPLLPYVRLER